MTILDKIVAAKRIDIASCKQAVPLEHVINLSASLMQGRSMKQALLDSPSGIISEFKRKSPSKGFIHPGADVAQVVKAYEEAGCSGISVLTDYEFFGGTTGDFKAARAAVNCPILRKDFIIDPYQLYVSKILGADLVLLIAANLTMDEAFDFGELAHELGMEVLLEVHNEDELKYISRYTDIVGVNNRNLKTFVTDVNTSFDLAGKIPSDMVKISESGLSDPAIVKELRRAGYQGFLMGEAFMKNKQPGKALANFISKIL